MTPLCAVGFLCSLSYAKAVQTECNEALLQIAEVQPVLCKGMKKLIDFVRIYKNLPLFYGCRFVGVAIR